MPAWLPLLKTVLPYVTNVVTTAIPVFTARRDADKAALVTQQIGELQEAARTNAESVKVLAEQLQRTIEALEAGATATEAALRRAQRLARIALGVAIAAVVVALAVLSR